MKIRAIIEIPEGSFDKIEIKNGVAQVDRKLIIPVPVNYGYIPGTLELDDDPLDVYVLSEKPLKTYDTVEIKPIGFFECTDQGVQDNKVFGVVAGHKFSDLTLFKIQVEIGDYLMNYKLGFKVLDYKKIENPDFLKKYFV